MTSSAVGAATTGQGTTGGGQVDYRAKAAEAWQQEWEQGQAEARERFAKHLQERREQLLALLNERLAIVSDQCRFHGEDDALVYVDGLEGVYFCLHTFSGYPTQLQIEIALPDVPEADPQYEEWWENPANKRFPSGRMINDWADVGGFLEDVERCKPIAIAPWAEPQAETIHPADKAKGGYQVLYSLHSLEDWLGRGWMYVATLSVDKAAGDGIYLVYKAENASKMEAELRDAALKAGAALLQKERLLSEAEEALATVDGELGEAINLLARYKALGGEEAATFKMVARSLGAEADDLMKRVCIPGGEGAATIPTRLHMAHMLLERILSINEAWYIEPALWGEIEKFLNIDPAKRRSSDQAAGTPVAHFTQNGRLSIKAVPTTYWDEAADELDEFSEPDDH